MLLLTRVWAGYQQNFTSFLEQEAARVSLLGPEDSWQRSNYRALAVGFNEATYALIEGIEDIDAGSEMLKLKESAGKISDAQFYLHWMMYKNRVDGVIFQHLCSVHHHARHYLGVEKAEEVLYSCLGQTARYVIREEFPDFQ